MKFILSLLFSLAIACQSKPIIVEKTIDSILELKNDQSEIWTEYYTKDSIPQSLIERLTKLTDDNFNLANPNEIFQATDHVNIEDSLPRRQLSFLGNYQTFWIMTYKHGGIGLHYHFVICKIEENKIKGFKTGVSLVDLESLNQIREAFSHQKIDFYDVEI